MTPSPALALDVAGDPFPMPPVDVIDARRGWWQARRRRWIERIGDGRETREHLGEQRPARAGTAMGTMGLRAGGSGFDPVLADLLYRWYAPPGGLVLDPFAGGATRGLVAAHWGLAYVGVDVRADQVAANAAAAEAVGPLPGSARWVHGDARRLDELDVPDQVDLVLTCPPYGGLERYSDQPDDLSTLDPDAYRAAHADVVRQACGRLVDGGWAVWVVGEARLPDGSLQGIVPDTHRALRDAGLRVTAEAVLLTPLGNAHLRAVRPFHARRTLTRAHQTVLVACAGDPADATARLAQWRGDVLDRPPPGGLPC